MPDSSSGSNFLSQETGGQLGSSETGNSDDLPYGLDSDGDVSSLVQGCMAESEQTVRIRASFFFDGTGNNRTNVALGSKFKKEASYKAGESNISKLEAAGLDRRGPSVDYHFTVYTEGIGTVNRGSDVPRGQAVGKGWTGVVAKVEIGINQAIANIRGFAGSRKIKHIHIDTFGFSRGAAAARHCIWKCMQEAGKTLKERLEEAGYTVGGVVVKFVGLYDTVSSYGLDHTNDTAQLHLDAISIAEKVVQLAAAEEHRANFRLTNIKSAGAKGLELFLPGVHSDVGGGYADPEHEEDHQLFDLDVAWLNKAEKAAIRRERQWLVAAGWYRDSELAPTNFWNEVKATRRNISNKYSRIPLQIMADFARKNGVYIAATLKTNHPIPPELSTADFEIGKYIGSTSRSSPGDWFKTNAALDAPWHKAMRHDYLHFSAYYGSFMGAYKPQWSNDDPVNGRRMRNIQDG